MSLYLPWFPLTSFYLSWLAVCLLQEQLSQSSYHKITDYGKIRFIIFSSIHLCIIGSISLLTTYTFVEILSNPWIMLSCTSISMILFIIMKLVLIVIDKNFHFVLHQEQKKDFRYFYHFLHLSIANILIQSILCNMGIYLKTTVGYLIFSNIVSLLLMANYITNLAMIFRVEHAETSFCTLNSYVNQANIRINQLKSSAHFDELTHAYSRFYLLQEATRLIDYQTLFSLVYIDLNHLKHINDTYGHKAGDDYLCNFVAAMSKHINSKDVLARFGGDEFILIMPECNCSDAFSRLNKIKNFLQNDEQNFPFSSGIVDSTEANTLDELISLADKRMYKEKMEKRRNETS